MTTDALLYSRIAPKPVHPKPVRFHGLFGYPFVSRHFMSDDLWTPNSVTEIFKCTGDMLVKHRQFSNLKNKAYRKRIGQECRQLKRQVRSGRVKLQNELTGDNVRKVRNYLINHKALGRLYQRMPLHMVADNINTRTFVLRKERDRWGYRLRQLEAIYENKLKIKADLENRIKYQNEFVLEEETKSLQFQNRIKKSLLRMLGFKTINNTYKKIIEMLHQDEIYYDPIIRSLNRDYDDLAAFIRYVLYLGLPAISKFKQLNEEYRLLDDRVRKDLAEKISLPQKVYKSRAGTATDYKEEKTRYVRETISMKCLRNQLENVENVIKQIKTVTLCSQAREIFPRMQMQTENNTKLEKVIENDKLGHLHLSVKQQKAELMEGLLINNRTTEEIQRLETIKKLRKNIEEEDEFETKTMEHLKNRSDAYVLLRFTLWNLTEILRHVSSRSSTIMPTATTQNSYLDWPLLKFEMLTMRSAAPVSFQQNVDKLLHDIKYKVQKLMRGYSRLPESKRNTKEYLDAYSKEFLDYKTSIHTIDLGAEKQSEPAHRQSSSAKVIQKILDHPTVKALSRKVMEENIKKDEV